MGVEREPAVSSVCHLLIVMAIAILLSACGGGGGGHDGVTTAPISPTQPDTTEQTIEGQFVLPSTGLTNTNCEQPSGYIPAANSIVSIQDETFSTLQTFTTDNCGKFRQTIPNAGRYLSITTPGFQIRLADIATFAESSAKVASLIPMGATLEIALLGYVWDSRASDIARSINVAIVDTVLGEPVLGLSPQQFSFSVGGVPASFMNFRGPPGTSIRSYVGLSIFDAGPICSGNLDPVNGSLFGSCRVDQTQNLARRLTALNDASHAVIAERAPDDFWAVVGFNQLLRDLAANYVKDVTSGKNVSLTETNSRGFFNDTDQLQLFPDLINAYSDLFRNNYSFSTITAPRVVPRSKENQSLGYFNVYPGLKSAETSPYTTIGLGANLPSTVDGSLRRASVAIVAGPNSPYSYGDYAALLGSLAKAGTPLIVLDLNDKNQDDQNLSTLAASAGGLYARVSPGDSALHETKIIGALLKNQYSMTPVIPQEETLNNRIPDLTLQLTDVAGTVIATRKIVIQ